MPFDKILIANRGEIACRVIRTARAMGIRTVAVFSDADAGAKHVQMADEAVRVGEAASAASYLQGRRIIDAALKTGAKAIHPGFGFLSENAEFCEAVQAAGLVWIGPPTGAIRSMGDKIESKRLAAAAGVSTVPGYVGEIDSPEQAVEIATEIGFPVMIKASAGGGGKGMRIAESAEDVAEGFRAAQAEAKGAFGDDRIFIEKFIVNPRHIEIQVLADQRGNIVHLGERECSIQRRHQKVIEEAPSPLIDPETRAAMGAEAIALAQAVDYASAGTVEFIADQDRNFYFLEMNTRLQVEHPVTELIHDIDLVEWMIRVAAGEELPFRQSEIEHEGWAVEARVYAEDPLRGFLPSIGRLAVYEEPQGEGVRVDSGVREGDEISMHYDPMIAKVIAFGADRGEAIERLAGALDGYVIEGLDHNVAFVNQVLGAERFQSGALTTNYIAEEFPEGFTPAHVAGGSDEGMLVALAGQVLRANQALEAADADGAYTVLVDRQAYRLRFEDSAEGLSLHVDGPEPGFAQFGADVRDWRAGERVYRCTLGGRSLVLQARRRGLVWTVSHGGRSVSLTPMRSEVAALYALMPEPKVVDTSRQLISPMPGLLKSVAVEVGQAVKAGETLAVVEAMKMENLLTAAVDGVVESIPATIGGTLRRDEVILTLEKG